MGTSWLLFFSLALTRAQYYDITRSFEREWQPLAREHGETLSVYTDWDSDWAQSFARRWPPEVQLIVYGGLAKQPAMTPDAFRLALCHELGHAYGGRPYKDEANHIAAEGQADDWAARTCLGLPPEAALEAAENLGQVLAVLRGEPAPSADRRDPTVVERTLLEHPSLQCRLDSWLAPLRGEERPRCWFAP